MVKRLRWLVGGAAVVLAVAMTAGPAVGQNGGSGSKENLTATDVGITPTEIRIGVIADTGSPIAPGLFQGAVDAVKAWAEYMNKNEGGLAGRKVVVDTYDSKLSADDATAAHARLSAADLDLLTQVDVPGLREDWRAAVLSLACLVGKLGAVRWNCTLATTRGWNAAVVSDDRVELRRRDAAGVAGATWVRDAVTFGRRRWAITVL